MPFCRSRMGDFTLLRSVSSVDDREMATAFIHVCQVENPADALRRVVTC